LSLVLPVAAKIIAAKTETERKLLLGNLACLQMPVTGGKQPRELAGEERRIARLRPKAEKRAIQLACRGWHEEDCAGLRLEPGRTRPGQGLCRQVPLLHIRRPDGANGPRRIRARGEGRGAIGVFIKCHDCLHALWIKALTLC